MCLKWLIATILKILDYHVTRDFFATRSDSEKFNQNLRTAMIHALTLRNKETITFFFGKTRMNIEGERGRTVYAMRVQCKQTSDNGQTLDCFDFSLFRKNNKIYDQSKQK